MEVVFYSLPFEQEAEYYFRQCTIVRGGTKQVAWIPEDFAVKDKFIKINDVNGWKVTEVSETRISNIDIASKSTEYKHIVDGWKTYI